MAEQLIQDFLLLLDMGLHAGQENEWSLCWNMYKDIK